MTVLEALPKQHPHKHQHADMQLDVVSMTIIHLTVLQEA